MAFGDSNSDTPSVTRVENNDDLAHLLYSERRQQPGQIVQAAEEDNLPSMIYVPRAPLRDNGPRAGHTGINDDGRTPFRPTGIYAGTGAPYSRYPMAPSGSPDLLPTIAPGADRRSPSPSISTRGSVSDIGIGNRSSNGGFFSTAWGDIATLVDYGVMIGAGRHAYKNQFGQDNAELDRFPKTVADKLKESMEQYGDTGIRYHDMLQKRYHDVSEAVLTTAKERKVSLTDILSDQAKADAYATELTAEQSAQFKVYREFIKESKSVGKSITVWGHTSPAKIDLHTPIVKPTIPITLDAPALDHTLGAKNPWAIRESTSQSIASNRFLTASESLHADVFEGTTAVPAAAKVDGKLTSILNSTNLWKLGLGYGTDFLYDRVAMRNSNPSLFTWGLDLAAAFTLNKPWGVARTALTMVGMHAGGRWLDSMLFNSK